MAVELAKKISHLARDFRATLELVEFIPYELEKRIVARLGLVKIEALHGILGAYKNQLKRASSGSDQNKIVDLERLIERLKRDIDGGIRAARNAQAGHNLTQSFQEIPEHWLFMGHSTFSILSDDIAEIETLIQLIDANYRAAPVPLPAAPSLLLAWAHPSVLGPPNAVRFAQVYAGPWTPDVASILPGGHPMQDAGLRVLGLCIMLRQLGMVLVPMIASEGYDSVRTRLLHELAMIDLFALEEAVYEGNPRGNTTSLVAEWTAENHPAVAYLVAARGKLNQGRNQWRDQIRNKVCAHMDLDVSAAMLEMPNWPMVPQEFHDAVGQLCMFVVQAARMDIRTSIMTTPVSALKGVVGLGSIKAPNWANT
jgi:hypothetical protein